jgi:DNA modification methylase
MTFVIHEGDALRVLGTIPDGSVQCCVTSPPYWDLRDYGVEGQIGNEKTPGEYVARIVAVFAEVRRVLREDGTCWVNLGDSYARGSRGPQGPEYAAMARRRVFRDGAPLFSRGSAR